MSGRPTVTLSLPALGTIVALLGVLTFAGGWTSSYFLFKAEVEGNVVAVGNLQARVNQISEGIQQDRERNANRLTVLEQDVKYITQGVAELKLNLIPKR